MVFTGCYQDLDHRQTSLRKVYKQVPETDACFCVVYPLITYVPLRSEKHIKVWHLCHGEERAFMFSEIQYQLWETS